MVIPDPSIATAIAQLKISVVVGDGNDTALPSIPLTSGELPAGGSAFLLRPSVTPTGSYQLRVNVVAVDKNGINLAVGQNTITAAAKGCNRMKVTLAQVPLQSFDLGTGGGGGGGGGSTDLAGADLLMSLP
ncbi:MAG TPA: hypothetical protein VIA18_09865, partial [Polyangia bacterium]|nr:hypothetical protein [Polyangia bacterium]